MTTSVRTIVGEAGRDYIVCEVIPCDTFRCENEHLFSLVFDARANSKDSTISATLSLSYYNSQQDSSGIVCELVIDDQFIHCHFQNDVGLESTLHAYSGHFGRSLTHSIRLDDSFSSSVANGDGVVIQCSYYVGSSARADAGTKLVGNITIPVVQRGLDNRVCRHIQGLVDQYLLVYNSLSGSSSSLNSQSGEGRNAPLVVQSPGRGQLLQATSVSSETVSPGARASIRYELLEEDTTGPLQAPSGDNISSITMSRPVGQTKTTKKRRIGGVNLVATKR